LIPEPSALADQSVVVPAPSRGSRAARNGYLALALFCIGHFFVDLYSSALGAFQPLLVDRLGLTLTQAGILGGIIVFSGSFLQPAYGYLSDRFHSRLFSALAPAVAGVFISALGLAPTYTAALWMVFAGGAGIASFHPQASARATLGIVSNRAKWMAVFISAGTLGLAFGPTYFSTIVHYFGESLSYWGALPGVITTLLLLFYLPDPAQSAHANRRKFSWEPLRAVWKPLTILYALVFLRSTVQIVFNQFLPLYLHRERGYSLLGASSALSLYMAAGALGGFVGGHLQDRLGGRRVILISMISCVPFLAMFFLTTGIWSLVGLALGGLTLLFTIPVNVVMAQDLAPTQAGTVSALMMGFAWGLAGIIFIPLVGWISDHLSLGTSLFSLIVFPFLGIFLTLALPRDDRRLSS
jgi:FSR family fosmidomycin resistance protein-like MFS transporter